MPDFIALRGDPSDGLPGAPGIGAKTAADLLQRHGSLEAAIAGSLHERPRVTAALTEHADSCAPSARSRRCGSSRSSARPIARPTSPAGARAARELGMRALAERLEAAGTLDGL